MYSGIYIIYHSGVCSMINYIFLWMLLGCMLAVPMVCHVL